MNENSIDLLEKKSSLEARKAIESFSRLANKLLLHPLDQERWFKFLIIVHKNNKEIDVEIVICALGELGWSTKKAHAFGLEFEFAGSLLSYIDE
jgi:hypothetical protein